MIGAGIGHVCQLVLFHDTAIGDAGPVLYLDFIVPVVMMRLSITSDKKKAKRKFSFQVP